MERFQYNTTELVNVAENKHYGYFQRSTEERRRLLIYYYNCTRRIGSTVVVYIRARTISIPPDRVHRRLLRV